MASIAPPRGYRMVVGSVLSLTYTSLILLECGLLAFLLLYEKNVEN